MVDLRAKAISRHNQAYCFNYCRVLNVFVVVTQDIIKITLRDVNDTNTNKVHN